jgi:hypothetical protein
MTGPIPSTRLVSRETLALYMNGPLPSTRLVSRVTLA